MKYERLTVRFSQAIEMKKCDRWNNCSNCSDFEGCPKIYEAIARLAELEDKIEDGLLVDLPCKVGDTVFYKCPDDDDYRRGEIVGIAIEKNGKWFHAVYEGGLNMWHKIEEIVQIVFFTEAEAKLKDLRGE